MKFAEQGFTLKELVVSLAIVSVTTAWGLPSLVEITVSPLWRDPWWFKSTGRSLRL